MNAIINKLEEQYDSSKKSYKSKIMSGARERATRQYFKDAAARARRKQNKVRFDTHRRNEQPTEEDLWLEDIHFANFLGIKDSKYGAPYNHIYVDCPVNINECDTMLPASETEEVSIKETDDDVDSIFRSEEYVNWFRQIEDEPVTNWHMSWYYDPETCTLECEPVYKYNNRYDEEQEAKCARAEELNFEKMVEYMREQVRLAEQIAANELYC